MQLFRSSNKPAIPRLIIKNTLFFAISQAFQGIPMQMAVTTGASMISYLMVQGLSLRFRQVI